MKFLNKPSTKLISILALVCLFAPSVLFAQEFIMRTLWELVVGIFGRLTALGGLFLDFAILEFVNNFGSNYTDSGIGYQVDRMWGMIRDIFNLTFIFGLVYIGFKMILNSDDSNTRKWLINLIIAALMVNFSLFATKAIVDISNSLASEITAAFPNNGVDGGMGVSEALMNAMGINSIWSADEGSGGTTLPQDFQTVSGAAFGYIFGAAIVFLVAAFVFAAGAFLLLTRYIILHIFLMLSPFLFIGFVFPQFMSTTQKYWSSFLKKAFVAPIYVLMLYFALFVMQGTQGAISANVSSGNPQAGFQQAFAGNSGAYDSIAGVIPAFLLGCGFLIAAVVAANKLGADGSDTVMRVGNTLQRGARRRLQQGAVRTAAYVPSKATNMAGEAAARRLDRVSGSLAQGNALSRFTARRIDNNATAAARAAANASIGGTETVAAKRKRVETQQARFNTAAQATEREAGGQYGRLSNERIQELVRGDNSLLTNPAFLTELTEAQMTALRDSGILTNDQFGNADNLRIDSQIAAVTQSFTNAGATIDELNTDFRQLSQTIRTMSADRKGSLLSRQVRAGAIDENIAFHLSDNDIDAMEQSGRFDAAGIQAIRTARDTARTNMVAGAAPIAATGTPVGNDFYTAQRANLLNNAQQAGQLPTAVFTEPTNAQYLTPQAIEQRMRNGMTDADIRTVRANINTYTAANPAASAQWLNWMGSNRVEAARFWNV